MHFIQSIKNEFCFDLPLFSKYPATSINSYFYKMTPRFNTHFYPFLSINNLDQFIYRPVSGRPAQVKILKEELGYLV